MTINNYYTPGGTPGEVAAADVSVDTTGFSMTAAADVNEALFDLDSLGFNLWERVTDGSGNTQVDALEVAYTADPDGLLAGIATVDAAIDEVGVVLANVWGRITDGNGNTQVDASEVAVDTSLMGDNLAAEQASLLSVQALLNATMAGVPSPSNPLWDDLRVSLSRANAGGDPPTWASFRDGVYAQRFASGATNALMFDVQLPHGWAEGSDIMPHIHWSPGNSTDTGAVRWGFEYTWANAEAAPGDAFPATTTIYFDDAAHGVAYSHQIATFPAVSGMGMRKSSVLMCRLFREGGHANDTFNTNAFAISFDLHIQLESSGSITEYPAP